jgi:hypothetical protein
MTKPANEKQQETAQQQTSETNREKEFSEAVERVYQHYGNDISAFQRDVQKEMVKRG